MFSDRMGFSVATSRSPVLIQVNGQPEERNIGGRRQSSDGGTSRIS